MKRLALYTVTAALTGAMTITSQAAASVYVISGGFGDGCISGNGNLGSDMFDMGCSNGNWESVPVGGDCLSDRVLQIITGENSGSDCQNNWNDFVTSSFCGTSSGFFGSSCQGTLDNPLMPNLPGNSQSQDNQKPGNEKPDSQKPDNEQPGEQNPDNQKPNGQNPDSQKPGSQKPDNEQPGEQNPDNQKPNGQNPDSQKPGSQKPDNQKPDSQNPNNQKPDNQKPDSQNPDNQKPDNQKPDSQNPDNQKPDNQKPNDGNSDSQNPGDWNLDNEKPGSQFPDTSSQKPDSQNPNCPDPDNQNSDYQKPDTQNPDYPNSGNQNSDSQGSGGSVNQEDSYIQQVVALVNQERSKAGLSPVTEDASISAAASIRAQEIVRSFSHTRPDGSYYNTVLNQNGIAYAGSGENIAYGQRTPKEVMTGWMNSQTHRDNILNRNHTRVGIGYYQSANGVIYWVQIFTY